MKGKRLFLFVLLLLVSSMFMSGSTVWAKAEKPTIIKPCKQCHTPQNNVLRGKLGSVSMKAETIKVSIGPATWLVSFSGDTKLIGAKAFNKIKKGKEIAIDYKKEGEGLYATRVRVKPPAKVPPEKLIKVDQLAKLIAEGPRKGKFTIVDARPGKRFNQGHIPGSISIYDAQFDKNISKLPKDKDILLIFYCGGPS